LNASLIRQLLDYKRHLLDAKAHLTCGIACGHSRFSRKSFLDVFFKLPQWNQNSWFVNNEHRFEVAKARRGKQRPYDKKQGL
jgi:hypothetical protein